MISSFFAWIFKVNGWKVGGTIPPHIKKAVVIAAPHTSNWDFVYALAAYKILDLPINYIAKKELFRFPFSILFKATGGIPVDRSRSLNFVDAIVQKIKESDRLYLLMAAEGTRKRVDKWKSGFYHAALGAGVPIILGYLDYKHKSAGFGEVIYPTGDKEKDMEQIRNFYANITGRNPELYNPDSARLETGPNRGTE
jgi:1-acyl-sn-glycerol-3-phosphate acyltransferase